MLQGLRHANVVERRQELAFYGGGTSSAHKVYSEIQGKCCCLMFESKALGPCVATCTSSAPKLPATHRDKRESVSTPQLAVRRIFGNQTVGLLRSRLQSPYLPVQSSIETS